MGPGNPLTTMSSRLELHDSASRMHLDPGGHPESSSWSLPSICRGILLGEAANLIQLAIYHTRKGHPVR
jgi:hypothetical protein